MPLRRTFNFNHLANGPWSPTGNPTGFPGLRTSTTNIPAILQNTISDSAYDENKWLGSSTTGIVAFDIRSLFTNNTSKSIIGFRLVTTNLAQCRVGSMWDGGGGAIEVLASTINTGALSTNSIVSNQECYVEIVFDWVNFTQTWRVDGANKYQIQKTSATMAQLLSTYPILLIGTFQSAPVFWTKDYYLMDGDINDVPLGPIIVRGAVNQSSAAAAGYQPSIAGLSARDVLAQKSTVMGGTDLWPNLQSQQATPGDLSSTFKVDYEPPSIIAVDPWLTARDFNATPRNVTPKITLNGTTSVGTAKALTTPAQFGSFNYPSLLAPDGGAWTPAKIAAASFTHSIGA